MNRRTRNLQRIQSQGRRRTQFNNLSYKEQFKAEELEFELRHEVEVHKPQKKDKDKS